MSERHIYPLLHSKEIYDNLTTQIRVYTVFTQITVRVTFIALFLGSLKFSVLHTIAPNIMHH